jgi:putative FmdB family regulatory protein
MPTYQYRCPIGHEFERVEKMSGRPRTKCPQCGRTAVRIISGGAGFIFKGSGFYITDYGKDGKGPRKDAEASPAPEAAPAPPVAKDAPAPKTAGAETAPARKEKPPRKKDSG